MSILSQKLSIVLITLNEEENLPRFLSALPQGVELVAVDSDSRDKTVELLTNFGARVFQRPFDHFSNQKNFALAQATKDFVFCLDADEVPTKDLWEEISKLLESPDAHKTALSVRRRQVFLGEKLRFAKSSDTSLRLFPRGKGEFQFAIHERVKTADGVTVRQSRNDLTHYSYRTITDYFQRFNRYTSLVAKNHFEKTGPYRGPGFLICVRFFSEFIVRYFFRGGFLDGYPGFVFSLYGSVYSFTKYAKWKELSEKRETVAS